MKKFIVALRALALFMGIFVAISPVQALLAPPPPMPTEEDFKDLKGVLDEVVAHTNLLEERLVELEDTVAPRKMDELALDPSDLSSMSSASTSPATSSLGSPQPEPALGAPGFRGSALTAANLAARGSGKGDGGDTPSPTTPALSPMQSNDFFGGEFILNTPEGTPEGTPITAEQAAWPTGPKVPH